MSPLEALRRFQIDCGDLETPESAPKLPSPDVLAPPVAVAFPEVPPPDLPLPAVTDVAENVPPVIPPVYPPDTTQTYPPGSAPSFPYVPSGFPPYVPPLTTVPVTTPPGGTVIPPSPVPEPSSMVLVLSGLGLITAAKRRRTAGLK